MLIRRYYKKDRKYPFSINNNYFSEMVRMYGLELAIFKDNAEYMIIFESEEEYDKYLAESYQRVLDNMRYYLDNINKVPTFGKNLISEKGVYFTLDGHKILGKQLKNTQKPKDL